MKFKDKVIVVTGGGNGIGLSIVKEFAKEGSKVALIDLDQNAGEKVCNTITQEGGEIFFFWGDIGEKTSLEAFAEEVIKRYGKIDYLINNACMSRKGIVSGCGYDDFNYVLRVGVTAPYMLTKLFKNSFNKCGAIVNISSTRAYMSQQDTESYTAAKGGISALTHALAISLSGYVRVNSISPGWIEVGHERYQKEEDKKQHPSQRIGTPLDIVRAVMFLCHEDNDFINGENIVIDGGMSKQMIYHGDYGWRYTEDMKEKENFHENRF